MRIKPIESKLEITRIKNGLTRNELSKKAKVGKSTVIKLEEADDYYPNANIAKKICDVLKVDFDDMFSIER